ncbi:hypothetical protein [Dankookia sp. GCM10030260]|uniref:hypothetical protein n=1 Tax=Dankookia sp. GCM10030260 TaxID=3273390 RepID=UPI0036D39F3F
MLLTAHRKLKDLPSDEVNRFWLGSGARLEAHLNTTAAEVLAAFQAFSAAGLVVSAHDRHLVSEAQRHRAQNGPRRRTPPRMPKLLIAEHRVRRGIGSRQFAFASRRGATACKRRSMSNFVRA